MNKPSRASQINATNLLLNCPPGTPNSAGSANGINSTNNQISLASLQCLSGSANSISPDSCLAGGQQAAGGPVNLSHSSNTNFSNNPMNSPYQDHSELNSPLQLMNHSFNAVELATANHLERLNGSLNSLGSNSSSSVNSNHSGSANSLLTFHSSSSSLKKCAPNGLVANLSSLANGLSNGLVNSLNNSPTFTSNRENINCNNVQWIEFQRKTGSADSRLENVPTPPNSLSNAAAFPPQSWCLGNLLSESNLCNANALALTANAEPYDYVNYTNARPNAL